MDGTDAGVWTIFSSFILATAGGLMKHVSAGKKHPCKDDIVFKKEDDKIVYGSVCEERGKSNDQAHDHLRDGIEKAIQRSDEQHIELKKDMKEGFSEIKTLINSK